MQKISAGLLVFITVTTAVLFIGINAIDSTVSVMVSAHPDIMGGTVITLFWQGGNIIFGYHLGILLVVIGYFLAVGGLVWYMSKGKQK